MKKLVLPALLALTLAACSSTGPETAGTSVEDRGAGVATVTAGSASGSGIAALTDPNNILSKRSVFFDFDSYVIKQEARALVEAHARFLVQNPQMRMLIQGNTDERGSRAYNLALGQKRADVGVDIHAPSVDLIKLVADLKSLRRFQRAAVKETGDFGR